MRKTGGLKLITILILPVGLMLMSYGIWAKVYYHDLVKEGNSALEENLFDSVAYEKAEKFPMASPDRLAYNLGLLAYKADNLERAASKFRQAIELADNAELKGRSFYNLGNIFTIIEQPKVAADMYREALRINPADWDAKYNLERLYVFNPKLFGEEGRTVDLEQMPDEKAKRLGRGRSGHSSRDAEPGL